jgi:hypothetical protein
MSVRNLSNAVVSRPSPVESHLLTHDWYSDWSQFLIRVARIASTAKFMVVSDFANYFDMISLNRRRQVLRSAGVRQRDSETVCYLARKCSYPTAGSDKGDLGIPQLYDDTPSLLGNLYLGEFDQRVSEIWGTETYARWMDDIVLGVGTEAQAYASAAELSTIARSFKLNLNSYKTRTLTGRSAYHSHLQIDVHRRLDEIELRYVLDGSDRVRAKSIKTFSELIKHARSILSRGSGEVVLRRLYRLSGLIGSKQMFPYINTDLVQYPGSSGAISQYLGTIHWSEKIVDIIAKYLAAPSNVYETVEVQLLNALLRREDLVLQGRNVVRHFAKSILSRRLPTISDTSIGIAAALFLMCEGPERAASELQSLMKLADTTNRGFTNRSGTSRRYSSVDFNRT